MLYAFLLTICSFLVVQLEVADVNLYIQICSRAGNFLAVFIFYFHQPNTYSIY